jgi:hypothetical protein
MSTLTTWRSDLHSLLSICHICIKIRIKFPISDSLLPYILEGLFKKLRLNSLGNKSSYTGYRRSICVCVKLPTNYKIRHCAIQVEFLQRQVTTATVRFALISPTLTWWKLETNFPPTHPRFPSFYEYIRVSNWVLEILKADGVLVWFVNKFEFTFTSLHCLHELHRKKIKPVKCVLSDSNKSNYIWRWSSISKDVRRILIRSIWSQYMMLKSSARTTLLVCKPIASNLIIFNNF